MAASEPIKQRRLSDLLSSVPRSSVLSSADSTLAADEELLVWLSPPADQSNESAIRRCNWLFSSLNGVPSSCLQVPRLVARIAELEEKLYAAEGGGGGVDDGGLLDRFGGLLRKAQQGLDAGIAYV